MLRFQQIEKYSYISFDVFDTLIKRSVAFPEDLFDIMEILGAPSGFALKRKEMERAATESLGRHATLDEIYARMGKKYQSIREMEIQIELDGCCPNTSCVALFHKCIAAGKTVVLLSDMYLPSEVISKMLEKCGVVGYRKLYISSEYGASKGDGMLYRKMLYDLRIVPQQIFHIGDNIWSDLLSPLRLGIRGYWVGKQSKQLCSVTGSIANNSALMQRTMQACVRNAVEGLDAVERQGSTILGPLLYGFTSWLVNALQHDKINDVYFMSREGLIMKQAFDLLNLTNIETHYLFCSRRSFVFPLLWKCKNLKDVLFYISSGNVITLRSFFLMLGIDSEKYVQISVEHGIDMDHKYECNAFIVNEAICEIFEKVKSDIYISSKIEFEALVDYFRGFKLCDRIAIVDIGYHGTMQNALIDLLCEAGINIDVKGYYLGIIPNEIRFTSKHLIGEGYLFDNKHGDEISREIRGIMTSLFEAQFLATHGSVKKFIFLNGHAVPSLYDFEYKPDESMRINEKEFIKKYHRGCLIFIQYMLQTYNSYLLPIAPDIAVSPFLKLGNDPTLQEATQWGNFRFLNYGKLFYIADPKSIVTYLFHPKQFIEELCRSEVWKIGFLKRLLRVKLPYRQIYHTFNKLHLEFSMRNKKNYGT